MLNDWISAKLTDRKACATAHQTPVRRILINSTRGPKRQTARNCAYWGEAEAAMSGWFSSQFLSISSESGATVPLNGYVCLFVSMPHCFTNILSSCALQPTVKIVSIASASPFSLMNMMLAPPYSWSSICDAFSPHFSLIFSGMSSRRSFISVPSNDLIRARGWNENPGPAVVGHHHQTINCTQCMHTVAACVLKPLSGVKCTNRRLSVTFRLNFPTLNNDYFLWWFLSCGNAVLETRVTIAPTNRLFPRTFEVIKQKFLT